VSALSRQRPTRPAVRGRRLAIAAARRASVEVGLAMEAAGGNAMDAAIAAAFVAGVIEPMETTLGGSGFMVLHAAGATRCLEFGPRAPLGARPDMFRIDHARMKDGGLGVSVVEGDANTQGILAAGVPATIPGLCLALEHHGRLPLPTVLAPAIRAARQGFEADGYFALEALANLGALRADPTAARLFLVDGLPPVAPHLGRATLGAAHVIRQPELACTLEALAERGIAAWQDAIFPALLATHREAGGLLRAEDGARAPALREALMLDLGGGFTACLPDAPSGGATVAQMLAILRALGDASPRALLHAGWHAFADRYHWLGDPDAVPVPAHALFSAGHAGAIARDIAVGSPPPLPRPGEGPPGDAFARRAARDPWPHDAEARAAPAWCPVGGTDAPPGTTHISAMDAEGMAVSLTHTAANHFGAKLVCPRTGLLLDAAMGWFNAVPGAANSIGPGRRPLANMAPALLLRDGRAVAAIGAPGGRRIIPCVAALLAAMAGGATAEGALAAPRADGSGDAALLDEALEELAAEVSAQDIPVRQVVREHEPYGYELARPVIAARAADGTLEAAADPFSVGYAAAA
jgi:gamma-glutamyltranspeptidase/glutathione hydrolase